MKNNKLKTILTATLFAVLLSLCCAACGSCVVYDPVGDIPGIKENAVLHIERNRLNFARGMQADDVDVIVKCGCLLTDDEGGEVAVTADMLKKGLVQYEKFDLETEGLNKRVAVTYNGNSNYIIYDVVDYTVDFYEEKGGRLWKSEPASAVLNDDLDLAVYIDIDNYNYSTDETAKAADPEKAVRFDGWYDFSDNRVTGIHALSAPISGSRRKLELYANYITKEQLADLKLSYDGRGRRVFSGYTGAKTETCVIPEGVTYVDLTAVFSASPNVTELNFEKLRIPSTARMDLPLQRELNTVGLREIIVDKGNRAYSSFGGAVYSKDYSSLYLMPASSENVEFHEAVTEFARASCAYWQATKVTIPKSVTILQHYCFAFSSLVTVEGLTSSVTQMTGVFLGTVLEGVRDGDKALYTVVSAEGKVKYMLSMILDKDMTEYTLMEGTVGIAGDAFNGCEKLVTAELGDELESIGGSAFSGCASLREITFPKTLKFIGDAAFYGCGSLQKVNGLSEVEDITRISENGTYEHTLPEQMFYDCSSLKEVGLPSGLKKIGDSAFAYCSSLSSLQIPDEVEEIGFGAFMGCGITSVRLPSQLRVLGSAVFADSKLESVDLNDCPNLTELSPRCFDSTHIASIVIPDRITSVPEMCFYGTEELTSVKMSCVESIGEKAFGYSKLLSSVELGNALRRIGIRAFTNCISLASINLPDSVTDIAEYAFQNCKSLTSLSLGKNVETFGIMDLGTDGVFGTSASPVYTCTALTQINVAEGNTHFASADGILYANELNGKSFGKNGVLYVVPPAYPKTRLTVESSVRVIVPYSVHYSVNVTEADFGNCSLENVGKGAFYMSRKLTTVLLPNTVTQIGANVILNCTAIERFEIASGGVFSTDGDLIYKGDEIIMYLGLHDTVRLSGKKVASAVFMNNAVVKNVIIGDEVESIGDKAFSGCSNLTSITIGSGLKEIGEQAFASLKSLQTITVNGNPNYKAVNNVLYSADGRRLILAAAGNGMVSPDIEAGVEEIGDYAFAYHNTLRNIRLPQGVKRIGKYAFYECRSLEYFYGAESLELVDDHAFSFAVSLAPDDKTETRYCDTLKKVMLYGGTKRIGDYAFYGQYGIQSVFFKMSPAEASELINNSGINIAFLTMGCPIGLSGDRYNEVKRYLYTDVDPTVNYNGYGWFNFDDNGEPRPIKEAVSE
ncbi:MAG: leucine-rich repeat domain-containing protein [Clostridia bacterium]|nr:leucine-rich repeat domain-containing protein [Clostridia bacterium]